MELLNVLVFAYYYPPMGLSGVQRVAKFTKYLPDFGWRPHVITTGATAYYAHDESMLAELAERDIVIHRTTGGKDPNALLARKGTVKMPREFVRKLLGRISNTFFIPDNKKSWSKQALGLARELAKTIPFDVIFVSGPPFSAMMAAAKLSTETGIPLVVDYRDLWYGNQFHFYPTPWHAHKHQLYEQEVLKHASRVIVTNRRIKERLIASYTHLSFEDVVIIPHGFDPLDIPNVLDLRDRSSFKITYSGLFYDFVTPLYFFRAVKKFITAKPDAKIEMHFAGVLRDEYKKMAKKAAKVWLEHGALDYKECVADDVKPGKVTSFPQSVKLKDDETVVFAYVVYKNRKERDRVIKKVMSDPRLADMMNSKDQPMDGKRMFWGGFKVIVDETAK